MGVVNTKANPITNAEALPPVRNPVTLEGGRVRSIVSKVEIAAGDDDGSVYRMARVHSSWRIKSIRKMSDAITGGTDFAVGLYQTAENGGAVVSKGCYADSLSLASADTTGTNVAFQARNIDNSENRVWQDAGLTEDPQRFYDLCFTGDTVGTVAGGLATDVEYVID